MLRAALAGFVLTLPSMVVSFTGLVFPERNVVFFLACLVLFVKRFEQTLSPGWAVAATVSAQIMIYYKESSVLLLWGLQSDGSSCAAGVQFRQPGTIIGFGTRKVELDLCLVCLGVLFSLYYVAAMLPRPNLRYADLMGIPLAQAVRFYLELDPLVFLFLGVMLARFYFILRGRVESSPLWDGLAFGGALCFAAYLVLGLATAYYMAPVDLIAVLYVGRLAILSSEKMRWGTKAVAFANEPG